MMEIREDHFVAQKYPILVTKLNIPDNPKPWLQRPLLIQKLNKVLMKKAALINASAGYGKTTLISSWLKTISASVAWLSLEAGDNGLNGFWEYMYAAFKKVDSKVFNKEYLYTSVPDNKSMELLTIHFIQQVMMYSPNVVLVLDNVENIHNEKVLSSLSYLIEHLPVNLKVVFISRIEPKLPLHRLRADNQLVDIDINDLRFRRDELTVFYNELHNFNLNEMEITTIENFTEGWVAGVNLIQINLEGQIDTKDFFKSFEGNNKYIEDYFRNEVINLFSREERVYLLKMSILDKFSYQILQDVLNLPSASSTISKLIINNNFIFPVEERENVYRFHNAFKSTLYQQFLLEYGSSAYKLHEKAAKWFQCNGDNDQSITHAFHAQNYSLASDYLFNYSPKLWMEGRYNDIKLWLEKFPENWISKQPKLRIMKIRILFITKKRSEVNIELNKLNLFLYNNPFENLQVEADIINGFVALLDGNEEMAIYYFKKITNSTDGLRTLLKYGLQFNKGQLSILHSEIGRYGRMKQMESIYLQLKALCTSELHPVLQTCQTILNELYYERNHLNKVHDSVEKMVTSGQENKKMSILIPNLFLQVKLASLDKDRTRISTVLEEAEKKLNNLGTTNYLRQLAFAIKAEVYINNNQLEKLTELMNKAQIPSLEIITIETEYPVMVYAEALSVTGRVSQSLELVDRLLHSAKSEERLGSTIKISFLKSIILYRNYQYNDAYIYLDFALRLASPERYIRTFTDKKEVAFNLLSSFRKYSSQSADLYDYIDQLLDSFSFEQFEREIYYKNSKSQKLVEPLTLRESDVLKLVMLGLTNKEIADKLFISVGTVKGYNHNIYTKLGVKNRTQAHLKAKELSLV